MCCVWWERLWCVWCVWSVVGETVVCVECGGCGGCEQWRGWRVCVCWEDESVGGEVEGVICGGGRAEGCREGWRGGGLEGIWGEVGRMRGMYGQRRWRVMGGDGEDGGCDVYTQESIVSIGCEL